MNKDHWKFSGMRMQIQIVNIDIPHSRQLYAGSPILKTRPHTDGALSSCANF